MSTQIYRQSGVGQLSAEKLGDGSTAIVDSRSKSVHSLNPTATLVWEACANGATLDQIRKTLEAKTGAAASDALVRQALEQLQRVNLIEAEGTFPVESVDLGRRALLTRAGTVGAIAIPVVLTLTAAEQKAYAFQAISGTTTTTPAPTTTIVIG